MRKESKRGTKFSVILIILIILISGYILWTLPISQTSFTKVKDSRIISAILQGMTVMSKINTDDGSYDNFSCHHLNMTWICQEVDINFGPEDGKEPIITHDTSNNSKNACIYSPLNNKKETGWWLFKKEEKMWYCADSSGRAGYTSINPGSPGYCVERESAVCPPLVEIE